MQLNQQTTVDLLFRKNTELSLLEEISNEHSCKYESFQQLIYSIDREAEYISEQYKSALDSIKRMEQELIDDHTCDKYDYMFAAFSGFIAGLVDAIFVGQPYKPSAVMDVKVTSKLQKHADGLVDSLVQRFAKLSGWQGPAKGYKAGCFCLAARNRPRSRAEASAAERRAT